MSAPSQSDSSCHATSYLSPGLQAKFAAMREQYGPLRPPRKKQRTRDERDRICAALAAIVRDNRPVTVRQVFYRAVAEGVVEKTEAAYQQVVGKLLVKMRKDGSIPYAWIEDRGREVAGGDHGESGDLEEIIRDAYEGKLEEIKEAPYVRLSRWADQPCHIQVWLEKLALAGIFGPIIGRWDVELCISRGYSSHSLLYQAAQKLADDRPNYLLFFGDYDPTGVDIPRFIEEELNELSDCEIIAEQVALTPEQINEGNLPTRPTKLTDSRSVNFGDESVELDAMPPANLRTLIERSIRSHIDVDRWVQTEKDERGANQQLSDMWDNFIVKGALE